MNQTPTMEEQRESQEMQYICTNCGHTVPELYKKYSKTSIKPLHCNNCHKIADKYIEFEPIIILVDVMLLSQESYRHLLHNGSFKLQWKLSLVLLLLESFALWRQKHDIDEPTERMQPKAVRETGFYLCCLQNIFDYIITTMLLFLVTCVHRPMIIRSNGVRRYVLIVLKAVTVANLSKLFLLPIMVWRENTTVQGADIHHFLVLCHHLFALVFIYAVVGHLTKMQTAFIVLPMYVVKEYVKEHMSQYIEPYF